MILDPNLELPMKYTIDDEDKRQRSGTKIKSDPDGQQSNIDQVVKTENNSVSHNAFDQLQQGQYKQLED